MQTVEVEVDAQFPLMLTFIEDSKLNTAMQYGMLLPPFPGAERDISANLTALMEADIQAFDEGDTAVLDR